MNLRYHLLTLAFILVTGCGSTGAPYQGTGDGGPSLDGGPSSDGGATGNRSCSEIVQCLLGCAQGSPTCADNCVISGSVAARGQVQPVLDCLAQHCAGMSGNSLATCMEANCETHYAACIQVNCSAASRLIYVVDTSNRLLSFNPENGANTFNVVGNLTCEVYSQPFSMSVDHNGTAWVLYSNGNLYKVSTQNAACQPSGYSSGQGGYSVFGMGFAVDLRGGASEKLYVSKGSLIGTGSSELGYIDPSTLVLTRIGALPQGDHSPELSGTASANLYAYYPGQSSSFVARIDKQSGSETGRWNMPTLTGMAEAWAFATWGGKFYVFVTELTGFSSNSKVILLDPSNGQTSTLHQNLPYKICGAGVSICAPIK